ncbi:penicillin acylase family protein [Aquihabitans daechungensis]|uniref:penicillin acylase family protein n=1 Tax=Aquihabitans daechungensis TaxID=1052257 RepID=UPI003BA0DD72
MRRTTDGVPHITGDTLADAAFGQGYASGEDRTCDLADQVVKIRGERARWFGAGEEDANLNSDIQWRAIGMFELAEQDWADVPEDAKALFESYAAGWNLHLEEAGVDGVKGWCAGEEWVRELEPVEIYAYARSISLNASGSRIGAFIATAAPPGSEAPEGDGGGEGAAGSGAISDGPIASNGWAIGSERSADGGGMLVGNPHFPWEGELRFWEVHLTVPGEVDAYGVQLSGVPGIGIGFTEEFGWTHTVSAGNRFTAYTLDLVPGDPTKYRYGDEERELTPTEHTIEVLGDDGEVAEEEHTTWASHYGPVVDFPGFGWTGEQTITYRDANVSNDEFIGQYFGMLEADSFEEFKDVHEEFNGIPLFNTIATSADGEAWYADTSATPNLSPEAEAAYEAKLASDPITQVARDNGAILLDGSDPLYEWVDAEGARDPGLVPYSEQPQTGRDDYVFNANDSFWMPHATEMLEGDYSLLHGRQQTPRTPRTRENATVLEDTTAEGASGDDGKFDLDELADASLANRGFTSRALLEEVVARCEGAGPVTVPEVPADEDLPGLPAGTVDIGAACEALAGWDGVYDLDRVGAVVWRETMSRFASEDLVDQGPLWAEPFDPSRPVATPSGLAPAPTGGQADPVLENLARAVQALDAAGLEPDVTLGEAQFALRNGEQIPIHGGSGVDGTTNVVGFGSGASIMDPALDELSRERVAVDSQLATIDDDHAGYLINNGTSFLMALAFTDDGPQAKVFLAYSDTEDRESDDYVAATRRFSEKDWRTVAFTEEDVAADTSSTLTVRG